LQGFIKKQASLSPFYKSKTEAHWCSLLPRDQPAPGRETI